MSKLRRGTDRRNLRLLRKRCEKAEREKDGLGLRLFVCLIFIFVIVVSVIIFTTVLRQFRQMPSFEDFPDVFGTESPVSGVLGR